MSPLGRREVVSQVWLLPSKKLRHEDFAWKPSSERRKGGEKGSDADL